MARLLALTSSSCTRQKPLINKNIWAKNANDVVNERSERLDGESIFSAVSADEAESN